MRALLALLIILVVLGAYTYNGDIPINAQYKYTRGASNLYTINNVELTESKNGVQITLELVAYKNFWLRAINYNVNPIDNNPARIIGKYSIDGGRTYISNVWMEKGTHTITIPFPDSYIVYEAYNESGEWYIKYTTYEFKTPLEKEAREEKVYHVEDPTIVNRLVEGFADIWGPKHVHINLTTWEWNKTLDNIITQAQQVAITNSTRVSVSVIVKLYAGNFTVSNTTIHLLEKLEYSIILDENGTVIKETKTSRGYAVIGSLEAFYEGKPPVNLEYPVIAVIGSEHSFTPLRESDCILAVVLPPWER